MKMALGEATWMSFWGSSLSLFTPLLSHANIGSVQNTITYLIPNLLKELFIQCRYKKISKIHLAMTIAATHYIKANLKPDFMLVNKILATINNDNCSIKGWPQQRRQCCTLLPWHCVTLWAGIPPPWYEKSLSAELSSPATSSFSAGTCDKKQ